MFYLHPPCDNMVQKRSSWCHQNLDSSFDVYVWLWRFPHLSLKQDWWPGMSWGRWLIENKWVGSLQPSCPSSWKQLVWFVIRFQSQREHSFVFWLDCWWWWRYWLVGLWNIVNQMRAESYQVSSPVLWLWKFVDFDPPIHRYRIQLDWLRPIG